MPRKLPLDLEKEILVRVPPLSLVRFRSVCKDWNTLFSSKIFVNKNFACARAEFMIKTHSHISSVSVDLNDDPTITVNDLCFDLRLPHYYYLNGICDGYFFMEDRRERMVIWNPLLRHTKRIANDDEICGRDMGYDGRNPEKSYKIIGRCSVNSTDRVAVLECATNTWKVTHRPTSPEELFSRDSSRVYLNGNLYWTGYEEPETGEYFIEMLDFSNEMIKIFCKLPCEGRRASSRIRVLSVYKGDRFSVLQQRIRTREIKIWVTEKKIGNTDDGGDVVWIKFMNISRPGFPLVLDYHKSISYFVDDNIYGKSFVLCCYSKKRKKPRKAWVYIVRGDMCKKIKIDGVNCRFESSVYIPSLITIA
ncbi:PREDICTED: putative F-box protein At1g58090 [Camelina sativa]|uniref:F-box protein At1g58090 n=1 Tax=Camelina sativa TaxID=90675 RepID=A0ABM0TUI4_CAMSA|nr:PREDICTED: putative F-box protein At1g58090 [Camelina sativa]